jgi:hypothetical protein
MTTPSPATEPWGAVAGSAHPIEVAAATPGPAAETGTATLEMILWFVAGVAITIVLIMIVLNAQRRVEYVNVSTALNTFASGVTRL